MDHRIQIIDLSGIGLEAGENEKEKNVLSSEGRSPNQDISESALILFEIIVGHSVILSGVANTQKALPTDVPLFVSQLIETRQSRGLQMVRSFNDILNILKKNDFEILPGVDLADVLTMNQSKTGVATFSRIGLEVGETERDQDVVSGVGNG
jgi:hypothetical protein